MHKKIIMIGFMILTMGMTTGCSKDVEEVTEYISIEATEFEELENFIEIPQDEFPAQKDPNYESKIGDTVIKAHELYFMTAEDFEQFCKDHYPAIADDLDVTWEEIDWITARDLLYKTLFGPGVPEWYDEYAPKENQYAPDLTDPEIIYLAPPYGFINSLTDEELIDYYIAKLRYLIPEISDADAQELKNIPETQYQEIRNALAEDEKEYIGYEYKKEDIQK